MREVFYLGGKTTRDRKTGATLTPGVNRVEDGDADLLLLRHDVIDQDRPDDAGEPEAEEE